MSLDQAGEPIEAGNAAEVDQAHLSIGSAQAEAEAQAVLAQAASPARAKRGRGRSRAKVKPGSETPPATWVRIGPGKFVRVEGPGLPGSEAQGNEGGPLAPDGTEASSPPQVERPEALEGEEADSSPEASTLLVDGGEPGPFGTADATLGFWSTADTTPMNPVASEVPFGASIATEALDRFEQAVAPAVPLPDEEVGMVTGEPDDVVSLTDAGPLVPRNEPAPDDHGWTDANGFIAARDEDAVCAEEPGHQDDAVDSAPPEHDPAEVEAALAASCERSGPDIGDLIERADEPAHGSAREACPRPWERSPSGPSFPDGPRAGAPRGVRQVLDHRTNRRRSRRAVGRVTLPARSFLPRAPPLERRRGSLLSGRTGPPDHHGFDGHPGTGHHGCPVPFALLEEHFPDQFDRQSRS